MTVDRPTDQWLTVAEAARSTGMHAERLRSLARRGGIQSRRGNAGLEVLVADGQPAHARPTNDRPRPTDRQEEITALKVALARAEGENVVLRERIDDLKSQMEHERTRADRLEADLRRPWWRKLLGP
jgi:chromosome segregation ATPase